MCGIRGIFDATTQVKTNTFFYCYFTDGTKLQTNKNTHTYPNKGRLLFSGVSTWFNAVSNRFEIRKQKVDTLHNIYLQKVSFDQRIEFSK